MKIAIFTLFLIIIQVVLIVAGVYQIKEGKIDIGLFNVIVNSFFLGVNILNLIKFYDNL